MSSGLRVIHFERFSKIYVKCVTKTLPWPIPPPPSTLPASLPPVRLAGSVRLPLPAGVGLVVAPATCAGAAPREGCGIAPPVLCLEGWLAVGRWQLGLGGGALKKKCFTKKKSSP